MNDLLEWLGEQLDEDERITGAATPGPWRAHDTHLGQYGYAATVLSGDGNDTDLRAWFPSMSQQPWDEARNVWNDAAHVARHDPARVRREIDVKRQILARYEELRAASREQGLIGDVTEEYQDFLLRLLVLPYADRPGYREEWRL